MTLILLFGHGMVELILIGLFAWKGDSYRDGLAIFTERRAQTFVPMG